MEGDLATGEVDRAGLSTYLHTYDLRKLYVVVHILTHSLPILPELSLRPEAEHVAHLLEDLPEPPLPTPLRFTPPAGSRSPSRTLSASVEPQAPRASSSSSHARISRSRTPEREEESMNVDEALQSSPSRPEEQPEEVTKQEEYEAVIPVFPQPVLFSPMMWASPFGPLPLNTTEREPSAPRRSPTGSPGAAPPGSEETMAIDPSTTYITQPEVVLKQEEPSRAHFDRRSPQDVNDEDDVSALLNSVPFAEPPLPITRNESTQSQYILAEPPASTLFAPPAFSFDSNMSVEPSSPVEEKPSLMEPPLSDALKFNELYTLPSLKVLPSEFQRKSKSSRRQKRDRDKDKDGKSHAEWAPLGANKWGATIRANPVATKVAKSAKVLSTRDWNVGLHLKYTVIATQFVQNLGRFHRVTYLPHFAENRRVERRWSLEFPSTKETTRRRWLDEDTSGLPP